MADVASIHRLRWGDVTGDGKLDLVVAPLFGGHARPPRYEPPARLMAFHTDGNPISGNWDRYNLADRPVIHAIEIRPSRSDRNGASVLTADNLGVAVIDLAATDGPSFTYTAFNLVSGEIADPPSADAARSIWAPWAMGGAF